MTTPIFGRPVLRSEDPRFLRGQGRYVENVRLEGALRAAFVRSMMAHARVRAVDVSEARSMPGVEAVLTAADLDIDAQPPSGNVAADLSRPVLASDVVRYVGEPIAIVIAATRAEAEDAAEMVVVDYDPLPAVVGVEAALADDAPLLFPEHGTNVADEFSTAARDDPLEGADVVVRGRFVNQRLAPAPMETNAFAAVPEGSGALTVWVSTQVPFDVRDDVAEALGLSRDRVHAIAPDVGGGFGSKLTTYPEYLAIAAAAWGLRRPVRWSEDRGESMLNLTHGRAQIHDVELGATREGSLVGMRVSLTADLGAYAIGAFLAPTTLDMLGGVYTIPRIVCEGRSVVTNATPVAPYRGAGRPEAAALVERAMDLLAAELGMDPVELRRRNLIPPEAFPYTTAVGMTYDSGEYERALDEAARIVGYDELRREQAARRESAADGPQLGIGVAIYVEITAFSGKEFGSVTVNDDGTVTVLTGISPHGQGHETSLAQLAAGVLGVPVEAVRVRHSDTAAVRSGEGTWGSRSLQMGGSAVWRCSHEVLGRGRRLAAHILGVAEADVTAADGCLGTAGPGGRAVSWSDVARAAADPARLPPGTEPGLTSEETFRQRDATFPFGAHVAVVEVDIETGFATLLRHIAVDDCGRILNPLLVDGQVHGGLAQGIGQALYEGVEYDENATPLTGSLATYGMPTAVELPSFETAHTETPTALNPLGVKGVGESATVGSTPAVQNAVVDAVSHLGVRHVDMPATPERIWRAIAEARRR